MVVALPRANGEPRLVAYAVPGADAVAGVTGAELGASSRAASPSYMVPSRLRAPGGAAAAAQRQGGPPGPAGAAAGRARVRGAAHAAGEPPRGPLAARRSGWRRWAATTPSWSWAALAQRRRDDQPPAARVGGDPAGGDRVRGARRWPRWRHSWSGITWGGAPARRSRPLPRRPGEPAPASASQARLWFLDRLSPGSAVYNVSRAVRLAGRLDVPALAAALDGIVARHEVLRTIFREVDGEPLQVVQPLGGGIAGDDRSRGPAGGGADRGGRAASRPRPRRSRSTSGAARCCGQGSCA